ncbi:hypothetical protein [Microtetraspora sp. NBRC 16547]|uniref:hypothetical protein n=1 Tax=Microtetraspora sp. NBRC 16547 TaxID=3030993 RepID=UPI0024A03D7B|nr:hypothetical protein [Microtetraspora sp. NBRC 16547]GLW99491.1 hypothetical protein Misp02_35780 [Microtetraspora sp. NBRC 16547]
MASSPRTARAAAGRRSDLTFAPGPGAVFTLTLPRNRPSEPTHQGTARENLAPRPAPGSLESAPPAWSAPESRFTQGTRLYFVQHDRLVSVGRPEGPLEAATCGRRAPITAPKKHMSCPISRPPWSGRP